jgi:hypothetical protein
MQSVWPQLGQLQISASARAALRCNRIPTRRFEKTGPTSPVFSLEEISNTQGFVIPSEARNLLPLADTNADTF